MEEKTERKKLQDFIDDEIFHYYNKKDPQEMGLIIRKAKNKYKKLES